MIYANWHSVWSKTNKIYYTQNGDNFSKFHQFQDANSFYELGL
jgi:hypothetical protein